jgi:hypothetical protein
MQNSLIKFSMQLHLLKQTINKLKGIDFICIYVYFFPFDFFLLRLCTTEQWLAYHWWYAYHIFRNPDQAHFVFSYSLTHLSWEMQFSIFSKI